MKIKCIIIDDEEMARAIMAQFITSTTDIVIGSEFSNALEAIKYLKAVEKDSPQYKEAQKILKDLDTDDSSDTDSSGKRRRRR